MMMLCLVGFLQPFSQLRQLRLLCLVALLGASNRFLELVFTLTQTLLELLLDSLLLLRLSSFLRQLRLQSCFSALLSSALPKQSLTVLDLYSQCLKLFAHLRGVCLESCQPLGSSQPLLLQLFLGFNALASCCSTDGTQQLQKFTISAIV